MRIVFRKLFGYLPYCLSARSWCTGKCVNYFGLSGIGSREGRGLGIGFRVGTQSSFLGLRARYLLTSQLKRIFGVSINKLTAELWPSSLVGVRGDSALT